MDDIIIKLLDDGGFIVIIDDETLSFGPNSGFENAISEILSNLGYNVEVIE